MGTIRFLFMTTPKPDSVAAAQKELDDFYDYAIHPNYGPGVRLSLEDSERVRALEKKLAEAKQQALDELG